MEQCFKRDEALAAFRWQGEEIAGYERVLLGRDELSNNRYNLVVQLPEHKLYVGQLQSSARFLYACEGDWVVTKDGNPIDVQPTDRFDLLYAVLKDEGEPHWSHSPKQ